MTAATARRPRQHEGQLLVLDESGHLARYTHRQLPALLRAGDLVVANDAATLPASLSGVHVRSGSRIEVRLAGRPSLSPAAVTRFAALVFGDGDYRTRTEDRRPAPTLRLGEILEVASLRARVAALHEHPRLVDVEFEGSPAATWEALAREGRPIQYAHVPQPLRIWDTWTCIAARPVAFEAPSAGFVLDWAMLGDLRRRGIRFATLTHAAGISSTGDPRLDALLPFDEPYDIPASTAAVVERTREAGGRIIAIGTTVVRALEHSARVTGHVVAGAGLATNRVTSRTTLRVANIIVSGVHEPGTSHYELLRAFQSDAALTLATEEASDNGFLGHEFGDAVLIVRAPYRATCQAARRRNAARRH